MLGMIDYLLRLSGVPQLQVVRLERQPAGHAQWTRTRADTQGGGGQEEGRETKQIAEGTVSPGNLL